MSKLKETLSAVDRYWFGFGSPTALGVFRICIATLAFLNLCMIGIYWDSWFGARSFTPAWLGNRWSGGGYVPVWGPKLSIHGKPVSVPMIDLLNLVTDPRITIPFYVLTTLFALTTALGLWTRFSAIALALGIVSMHHRNEMILHGGDTVLRVTVLYLALSPCGRACSIDRLVRLWRGQESGEPVQVSLWSQKLITYNVALIYFTTVWEKWYGHLWKNGTATWYPARLAEFFRFPVPRFVNELPVVYVTTYGTLLAEFGMATLVFYRPTRKWCLLGGVGLHLSIDYSMNIPLFSYLMMSMYICFFDGEEISVWAERLGERFGRFRLTARLPQGMRLRPASVAFFEAVDPLGLVTYLPGDSTTMSRGDVRGSRVRSIGAWVFGWIPGIWRSLLLRSLEPVPELPALEPVREEPVVHSKRHSKKAR